MYVQLSAENLPKKVEQAMEVAVDALDTAGHYIDEAEVSDLHCYIYWATF